MRVAVISDIHSNLSALRAVLADAGAMDEIWCLGDLVGYGPFPNECIEELRRRTEPLVCIAGNHDQAALGVLDTAEFNRDAEQAALWTAEQLTPANRAYLANLPEKEQSGKFLLVHGSPRHPIWEYVVSLATARDNLALLPDEAPFCLIGHSHLPLVFSQSDRANENPTVAYPAGGEALEVGRKKLLINPGSVGQPRDGNPDASYLLLDSAASSIVYRRVAYPIEETQRAMSATGRLSERLIRRLSHGV